VAYDFLSGQFGATRGSGFGGRATGSRFANIYGYNNGQAVTDPQQMAQIQQQRNAAPQTSLPSTPGDDFFAQLAGLVASPMQQQPSRNPNIPQYNQGNWRQTMMNPGSQYRQIVTPGGVGPYGGIAREDRQKMFEGRARGFGSMGQSPFRFGGGR
jgi:hypothetical protein